MGSEASLVGSSLIKLAMAHSRRTSWRKATISVRTSTSVSLAMSSFTERADRELTSASSEPAMICSATIRRVRDRSRWASFPTRPSAVRHHSSAISTSVAVHVHRSHGEPVGQDGKGCGLRRGPGGCPRAALQAVALMLKLLNFAVAQLVDNYSWTATQSQYGVRRHPTLVLNAEIPSARCNNGNTRNSRSRTNQVGYCRSLFDRKPIQVVDEEDGCAIEARSLSRSRLRRLRTRGRLASRAIPRKRSVRAQDHDASLDPVSFDKCSG